MYFLSILTLLASVSTALLLPASLPDGIYAATRSPTTGGTITRLLANITAVNTTEVPALLPRTVPFPPAKVQCRKKSEGVTYSLDDEAAARNSLDAWCRNNGEVHKRGSYVVIVGTARLYVCNTAWKHNQPCSVAQWDHSASLLDGVCGVAGAGNAWYPDWQKTYGRDAAGQDMCWGYEGYDETR